MIPLSFLVPRLGNTDQHDSALTLEEIPIKLRCAGCNKIAINAFRMPCCDQSLCETCKSSSNAITNVCLY